MNLSLYCGVFLLQMTLLLGRNFMRIERYVADGLPVSGRITPSGRFFLSGFLIEAMSFSQDPPVSTLMTAGRRHELDFTMLVLVVVPLISYP